VNAPSAASVARTLAAERVIGRLLIVATSLAVASLVVGAVLMITGGIDPLSGGPNLDLASLAPQVTRLQPAGFLWLGLLAVIGAPIGRVIIAAVAYARAGDRLMVGISLAILLVIAVGIASAVTVTI
jgi:uncharacterized membrane protein